jgi:hypothetical protein
LANDEVKPGAEKGPEVVAVA